MGSSGWIQMTRSPTRRGARLEYDALLLAVGARADVPYEHVTVFDDAHADDTYRGVVQDIEEGYTHSLALLLPDGPAWPLPDLRARAHDGAAGGEHVDG